MDTSLYIDLASTVFLPGDPLSGKILWALERPPGTIRLSLGWWTEGRGTRDYQIAAEQEWPTDQLAGEESFAFTLPETPYSFTGHLISLKWALELSTAKGGRKEILEITVSPHGAPVELVRIEDVRRYKAFASAL